MNADRRAGEDAVNGGGTRVRHRDRRRREFLDTALSLALRDGLSSLTMHRVTQELGASTGAIYQYFPTKGSLIAALQNEAFVTLGTSVAASQSNVAALVARDGAGDDVGALAHVVAAARFWVAAEEVFPREVEICRRVFTHPTTVVELDEGAAALPTGLGLITLGEHLFDTAVGAGALREGSGFARTVTTLASITGVQLAGELDHWEHRLREAPDLSVSLVRDLFIAWGATPAALDQVDAWIAELSASGAFVPPVDREQLTTS